VLSFREAIGSNPILGVMKTTSEAFEKLNESIRELGRAMFEDIGYILCESSFRIEVDDKYYNDNLDLINNCPLFIKFKIWLSWKLYHYGCEFYGKGIE